MERYFLIIAMLLAVTLGGCASELGSAPTNKPVNRPLGHFVMAGDTLYGLALEYNLDYLQLAKLNNIPSPYAIYPGQIIKFGNLLGQAQLADDLASTQDAAGNPKIVWSWPMHGVVRTAFGSGTPANKGIDIDGVKGAAVLAAGAGEVLYAGRDIRGLGHLVILQHQADYLSAYAINQKLSVKEGKKVRRGQPLVSIKRNGNGTEQPRLHFEIRYKGQPVDPLKYLPSAQPRP